MSYYEGKTLAHKVKQHKLEKLQAILQTVADGTAWPGDCTIQLADGTKPEQIRNTIYSILLELDLKSQFTVRVQHKCVKVEAKTKDATTTFGAVHFGPAIATTASDSEAPTEPYVDPDTGIQEIFEVEE
jgi:hypothetical protein